VSNFSLNNEVVRRYLIRALAGDSDRPRPPITLAGRQPDTAPQPASPQPPAPAPPIRSWPTHDRPRASIPWRIGDEQWTYSRRQLEKMDRRFRVRLLRALKRGTESLEAVTANHNGHGRVRFPVPSDP
jgi:hypothetical protein